jgi:putative serine protease PepD
MTDPLLWLHGDPTEGRRARVREPEDPAAAAAPPASPPAPPPARRGGRFAAAVAGGLISATLVTGGAAAFGLIDAGDPPAANAGPPAASVGARQQGDVAAIYEAASPAVVSVRTGGGSGTGFVVDADGTIVTNAHVVGDASDVQVQFADERTASATVRGVDRSSDLAVLDVDTADTGKLHALELADSTTVRTGQLAVAIGSPFGLPQTATSGIVSGTGRHIQAPDGFQIDSVIQTDAPINPGNSGGPLLDANGRVIGVNTQIQTGGNGNGNVGIGFAVPANTVRDVIPRLERGETIRRPYLGVSTAPGDGGAVVREATAGGPAARAGLRAGDVIVAVGGAKVREPDDVATAIQDRRPGQTVTIEIERNGDRRTLEVELGTRPGSAP